MKHDWVTKIQCSLCLGVQTPENKDDEHCTGMIKGNFRFDPDFERARGVTRREDGAIPKEALIHGMYYYGRCRTASIARWDAVKQTFVHWRYKFGNTFLEETNCREDELHMDVFDPWVELGDHDYELATIPVSDLPPDHPQCSLRVPKPTS
jgi:hypothetical protein